MELFEPGPINGKSITAEVCAHHLYFSSEDYATRGNAIKCNPAVKSPADRAALRRALLEGRLDIIATDHAPHTREEKANPDYLAAPAGLPLVQDALLSVFELYHDGVLGLAEIVEKTAHNPAIRFNVRDRGYLREGYYADLVLLDLAGATEVTAGRVLSRCGWSPFDGVKFRTRISSTFVNGQLAFDGENVFDHRAAMRLEFDRPAKRN
jgi:dihydroorotase